MPWAPVARRVGLSYSVKTHGQWNIVEQQNQPLMKSRCLCSLESAWRIWRRDVHWWCEYLQWFCGFCGFWIMLVSAITWITWTQVSSLGLYLFAEANAGDDPEALGGADLWQRGAPHQAGLIEGVGLVENRNTKYIFDGLGGGCGVGGSERWTVRN